MQHPVFLFVSLLNTLQQCRHIQEERKLDLRTKICDLLHQCITCKTSAYDLQSDSSCPCMYTQVQELASSLSAKCEEERDLQRELQVISSMLLTSSLTACLARPLPCDSYSEEWLQKNLRDQLERLTSH
jgi:hypothetical protein